MGKLRTFLRNIANVASSQFIRSFSIILVLVSLIPSLLVFAVMFALSENMSYKNAEIMAYDTLLQANYNINMIARGAENVTVSLYADSHVLDLLRADELAVGNANRSELRSMLETSLKTYRETINMLYLETEKNVIFHYITESKQSPYTMRLMGSEAEPEILKKHGDLYWLEVDENELPDVPSNTGVEYSRVASAIYDINGSNCLGIFSIFLKTSALRECLTSLSNVVEGQTILITDPAYNLICANDLVSPEILSEIKSIRPEAADKLVLGLGGIDYAVSVVRNEATDWNLISMQPKSTITRSLHTAMRPLLLPLVLLPLSVFLVTFLSCSKLISSLSPLLTTMEKIQEGDLTVRVPQLNDSAFGIFGQTLNDTLDKYEQLVSVNANQATLLTVSRLKLLRGQLSPHFLYNTLDAINWMLVENEQFESSKVITDLGLLLRYSINETPEKVSLQEEISVIERYLSICKSRFEERLSYTIYISPSLVDYLIPRFLLQPVVENAIIHGIERCSADGHIAIRCYEFESRVIIDISNDGPSIPDDKKKQLLDSFSQSENPVTHIGLSNVNDRIRLSFGEEYGLSFIDMQPHGAIVRLSLPGIAVEENV